MAGPMRFFLFHDLAEPQCHRRFPCLFVDDHAVVHRLSLLPWPTATTVYHLQNPVLAADPVIFVAASPSPTAAAATPFLPPATSPFRVSSFPIRHSPPLIPMASTLPPLWPHSSPLLPGLQRPPLKSAFLPTHFGVRRNPNPSFSPRFRIISAAADSGASWETEEARWFREEQRWIREERRWLREESCWNAERESLLHEVAALRLCVESLEREALLRASSDPRPVLVEKTNVKEMVLEEVGVSELAPEKKEVVEEATKKIRWKTLRKGSEGEDVRVMQVCVVPRC